MNSPWRLEVCLHGDRVGTITRFGSDQTAFAFDEAYINAVHRPTLGLGFKNLKGDLITRFPNVSSRLMPFFSNLLPEGVLREYLARQAGVKPHREFFLLHALGQDLPGAVTVRGIEDGAGEGDLQQRKNVIREHDDVIFRFSLAGVQLKFSALAEPLGGLTIPAHGWGGSWIVKLPSMQFEGLPENEFSMMQLAKSVGISVPDMALVDIMRIEGLPEAIAAGGALKGNALALKRFDRGEDGRAIHMEDFAQVFGVYPEDKYQKANARNIAHVLSTEATQADVAELIRRLTFNALIGNADMHLKNWSVIYPDRQRPRIAPAYDLVSTIAFLSDDQQALKVSRSKRFRDFSILELRHLARRASLDESLVLETAKETVEAFHHHWHTYKNHWPLSKACVDVIDTHIQGVPIGHEF